MSFIDRKSCAIPARAGILHALIPIILCVKTPQKHVIVFAITSPVVIMWNLNTVPVSII